MKKNYTSFIFLSFIICASLLLIGCQATSFVGRGQDGALRKPAHDQITEMNGQNHVAKPPTCGQIFTVSGRSAKGVVNCQNVNYADVYQEAQNMAQAQLNELTCPANCRPLNSVEQVRIWNCVRPDPNAPAIAVSTVERQAICTQAGAPALPAARPVPTAAQLRAQQGIVRDMTKEPGIIEDVSLGKQVTCPGNRTVLVDYQSVSPQQCRRARFDFTPYVTRATSLAQKEWDTFTCAPGCTKKAPFSTLKRRWKCNRQDPNNNLVEAQLWYEVDCVSNGAGTGSSNGISSEED